MSETTDLSTITVRPRRRRPVASQEGPWIEFLRWTDSKGDGSWLFRGHEDRSYNLRPTSGRMGPERASREKQIFRQFKRQARIHIPGASNLSEWEWLTLAQHYGVPTRLLDWTYNPLVAAFFAVMRNAGRDAEIVAVRTTAVEFIDELEHKDPFDLTGVMFLEAPAVAARVSAQSGLFTVHPQPTVPWAPPSGQIEAFAIPRSVTTDFRQRLMSIGVHAASVWGDLQGLGDHLKWHFESERPFASDGQATFIKLGQLTAIAAIPATDAAGLEPAPAPVGTKQEENTE